MDRRVVRASFSAESTTVRIIDSVPTLMIRCSVLKRSMSFESTLEMEVKLETETDTGVGEICFVQEEWHRG